MSKSQSGLGTVRREWSRSSGASQEIYWPPTPPVTTKPAAVAAASSKLTPAEERLRLIQEALAGSPEPEIVPQPAKPFAESRYFSNKRPNDTDPSSSSGVPTKKPRQLPPSFNKEDPLVAPSSFSLRPSKSLVKQPLPTPPSSGASTQKDQPKQLAKVFLSQEQTHILGLVEGGQSLFYTGSAGTGKSVLLREIIKTLRKKFVKFPEAVAVTASTGIAACNIGGVTIHSFSGIGLGIEPAEALATKVRKNRKAFTRWQKTKVLIIDEVSMVDGDLFDKLASIGKILRKKEEPFGGIQVIVTGDFFQLPPVARSGDTVKFAFEAQCWKAVVKRTFNLTKVFRQSDQEFVNMLNEMRFGKLSPRSLQKFKSLSRPIHYTDGLEATELYPRREDVERSNATRLNRLQTLEQTFIANDGGEMKDPNQREKVLANFISPQKLVLRVDAQVMLIKNVDDVLVNGTMGRVVRFVDPAVFGTEHDGEAEVGNAHGVIGSGPSIGTAGRKKTGASAAAAKLYPIVEFLQNNGDMRSFLVLADTWKTELPNGEIQVSRMQLPLILAWAMSIHKSQGQTLERVRVDLGKVFEKGQAYVALSRATCLEGLQVLNFDSSKVMAHPKVTKWSQTLETLD